MVKNNSPMDSAFENLKKLEAQLLRGKYISSGGIKKSWSDIRELEDARAGRKKKEPSQKAAGSDAEYAILKEELDSARTLLIEHNVMTSSSISALKELMEDYNRLKAILHEMTSDISELNSEICRLKAEARLAKKDNAKLKERLAKELAQREKH